MPKILVIDDEDAIRDLLATALRRNGFRGDKSLERRGGR